MGKRTSTKNAKNNPPNNDSHKKPRSAFKKVTPGKNTSSTLKFDFNFSRLKKKVVKEKDLIRTNSKGSKKIHFKDIQVADLKEIIEKGTQYLTHDLRWPALLRKAGDLAISADIPVLIMKINEENQEDVDINEKITKWMINQNHTKMAKCLISQARLMNKEYCMIIYSDILIIGHKMNKFGNNYELSRFTRDSPLVKKQAMLKELGNLNSPRCAHLLISIAAKKTHSKQSNPKAKKLSQGLLRKLDGVISVRGEVIEKEKPKEKPKEKDDHISSETEEGEINSDSSGEESDF